MAITPRAVAIVGGAEAVDVRQGGEEAVAVWNPETNLDVWIVPAGAEVATEGYPIPAGTEKTFSGLRDDDGLFLFSATNQTVRVVGVG